MNRRAHAAVRLSAAPVATVAGLSAAIAVAQRAISEMPGIGPAPKLPEPHHSPSAVNFSRVIGWPEGRGPAAPEGFQVEAFGAGLESPRWLHVLPNGDVLVAEARTLPKSDRPAEIQQGLVAAGSVGVSPNRVTLLRDADRDGTAEVRETFVENLNQPFGMALVGDKLYVANTDGVVRFPYKEGQTRIDAPGELNLPLPAGGYNNHWTRNIIAHQTGKSSTSPSARPATSARTAWRRRFAGQTSLRSTPTAGLRRCSRPGCATRRAWTGSRRRAPSGLRSTSATDSATNSCPTTSRACATAASTDGHTATTAKRGPRRTGERPDLVARAIAPDYALGSHTASLGLVFYDGGTFPERYRGGAFVGQRGSWNRSEFSGYRVAFVPFKGGKPSGAAEDFLTGFIANAERGEAYGRPVGLALLPDGSLLVADDAGNTVWRVKAVE